MIFIKNESSTTISRRGIVIGSGAYYLLPDTDKLSWANDSQVLSDIANNILVVAKTDDEQNDLTDLNAALNYLKGLPSAQDPSGRNIIRVASTKKGWHFQAHSIQFNINALGSIYNKDENGNDLGFTTMKVLRADGTECLTQADADTTGCKTIVTWAPSFDFEVISGNVRQESKNNINSYMYVNSRVPTGLPAPNDFVKLPFVQGGVNLKYIGADELLKTDGRSAKLLPGSLGACMEVVINYQVGAWVAVNNEISVIFEIYKEPLT